jgi:pilus assembly protein CpaE
MRRIALLGSDEMLIGRVRAATADLAAIHPLPDDPNAFGPRLVVLKPAMVLIELESGGGDVMPEMMQAIAAAAPDVPVLAIGDAGNASDVLASIRAGATDFLDHEEPVPSLQGHIARRLAAVSEPEIETPEGNFTLVLNAQPGSAAGLFALNLALHRAQRTREALFIDCHLPVSEAGAALDVPLAYSLGDAARDIGRLDRTLLLSAIAEHIETGLRVLPLSLRSTDDLGLSPETLLAALRAIRPLFGDTVLNAGGIREPHLLGALSQWASAVFLVCPQKFTALRDAQDLMMALPGGFDAARHVTLIVDEYSAAIDLSPEQMLATLKLERMAVLPQARDELINGMNIGRPFILSRPRTPYALAIEAAAEGRAPAPQSRLGGFLPSLGGRLRKRA